VLLRAGFEGGDDILEQSGRLGNLSALASVEPCECGREPADSTSAGGLQQAISLGGRPHLDDAAIVITRLSPYETARFESLYDPRHRGRLHALGAGQLAKAQRTAKDDHR